MQDNKHKNKLLLKKLGIIKLQRILRKLRLYYRLHSIASI